MKHLRLRILMLVALLLMLILCFGSCSDKSSDIDANDELSTNESMTGEQNNGCAHEYDEEITKEPTCTVEGEKKFTCRICGGIKVESVEKISHTEEVIKAVNSTCTATGLTEGKRCSTCQTVIVRQNVTPVRSHNFSERKEDANHRRDANTYWYNCSDCNMISSQNYWTKSEITGSANLEYTYDVNTLTASLSGIGSCTDKAVKIPNYITATVDGVSYKFAVTSIGENALYHLTNITSVTIPDSVTKIGDCAFSESRFLESVNIPNSVTSIGKYAFQGCAALKSITIPNSVTEMGDYAFRLCISLENVTLGNSLSAIGIYAFSECFALESIVVPDSVTEIKYGAFEDCAGLSNIKFGKNLYTIGTRAFENCVKLTSIVLPEKITVLGEHAFRGCTSLKTVTLGNELEVIHLGAFRGCAALESVALPKTVTLIEIFTFEGCSSLKQITYAGTEAQWNDIDKGFKWDNGAGKYTVEFN